jgi:hypothetical protein
MKLVYKVLNYDKLTGLLAGEWGAERCILKLESALQEIILRQ